MFEKDKTMRDIFDEIKDEMCDREIEYNTEKYEQAQKDGNTALMEVYAERREYARNRKNGIYPANARDIKTFTTEGYLGK